MSFYAADGSWNVTVVDGSTRTGLIAPDGSRYVVVSGGAYVNRGLYHPCGAMRITVADGTNGVGRYAFDGSLLVSEEGLYNAQRITVISGDIEAIVEGATPSDIALDDLEVDEDAELGEVVGTFSFTDPNVGETGTYTLTDDSGGMFGIDGSDLIVTGVLDFETAETHSITVLFTDSDGLTRSETFEIAVIGVAEDPPTDPPPDDVPETDDDDNFSVTPYTVEVDGAVKFAGKKKNNGKSAKFIHDFSGDLGDLEADKAYIFSFTADFSLMEDEGSLTAVGLMFKHGNDFFSVGVKGDGGATDLDVYSVDGTNKWNAQSGYTLTDEGPAENGSQWGPIWVKFITSEDGTAISMQTGTDVNTWDDEVLELDLGPFTDISDVTQWGIGGIFDSDDSGPYSITVTYWDVTDAAETDPEFSNVKLLVSGIGSNGATTFPDLSPDNNGNGTATGNTQITTTSPVGAFSSSIYTDGTGDLLTWPKDTFQTPSLAAAVWTIEFCWKPVTDTNGTFAAFGEDWTGVGAYSGGMLAINDGSIRCFSGVPVGVIGYDFTSSTGNWVEGNSYFVCLESNGSKIRLYLGNLAGSTFTMIGSATPTGAGNPGGLGSRFRLGSHGFGGDSNSKFNWIRLTDTVARYNSDAGGTIPTFPLPTA